MGEYLRLSLQAFDSETPPSEFRIFSAGENQYRKEGMDAPGAVTFDAASGKQVIERWNDTGRKKMAIDYDHSTHSEKIGRKIAAGWFVPEVRGNELWATNVSWTKRASKHISEKEYLYYSPSFEVDASKRVVGLRPVALTNDPALFNLRPLIQASASPFKEVRPMKLLLNALGLEEGADEAVALSAVQPLKDLKAQILTLSGKLTLSDAIGALTAMKAQAEKVETLSAQVASLTAEKEAVEVGGLLDEAIRDGRITPAKREEFAGLVKSAGIGGLKTCLSMLSPSKAPAVEKKDEPVATAPALAPEIKKIIEGTGLTVESFSAFEKKHRTAVAAVLDQKEGA